MPLTDQRDTRTLGAKYHGIQRLEGLVKKLIGSGGEGTSYYSRFTAKDIASSASVKDSFSARLKQSRDAPQIVTVQPRGQDAASEYVIIPIEEMNRLLEAQVNAKAADFVPITAKLKAVSDAGPLPALLPRKSGLSAQRRRAVPEPQLDTASD